MGRTGAIFGRELAQAGLEAVGLERGTMYQRQRRTPGPLAQA